MMINKRLIGTVSESKKYIAGNVVCQWISLVANIVMMAAITGFLAKLFETTVETKDFISTVVIAVMVIVVRYICATLSMSATSKIDSEVAIVTREQMENEKHYQATMAIAKNLLNEGIISEEEYCQIDTKFKEQYAVTFSTLFTDINLIKYGSYGNI